jgi:hypothetical protein
LFLLVPACIVVALWQQQNLGLVVRQYYSDANGLIPSRIISESVRKPDPETAAVLEFCTTPNLALVRAAEILSSYVKRFPDNQFFV